MSARYPESPRNVMRAGGVCTVPAKIRKRMGFAPGSRLGWEVVQRHTIIVRSPSWTPPAAEDWDDADTSAADTTDPTTGRPTPQEAGSIPLPSALHESTVGPRGQTTMPAAIRNSQAVVPGTALVWHDLGDGRLICRAKTLCFMDLRGSLVPEPDIHVTVEAMNPFR